MHPHVAFVVAAAFSLSAPATQAAFLTGNQLYEQCADAQSRAVEWYVVGALDLRDWSIGRTAQERMCVPLDVVPQQIRDVICKYLGEHPETRHRGGGELIAAAMQDAWTCT